MIHFGDQIRKHCVSLLRFALQVFKYAKLSLGGHHIHMHRSFLTKPPAPAHALVILLIGMTREKCLMIAVLPVHSETGYFWLRNQHAEFFIREADQSFLFLVVRVFSGNLDSIRNQLFEQVALIIQMTPNKRRLSGIFDQFSNLFAPLLYRPASFFALFFQSNSR